MTNIIETAKKLQALAERGIGGEQTNAEQLLRKFMAKHGITEANLENPDRERRDFYMSFEKRELFLHIMSRVMGQNYKNHWEPKNGKYYICTVCTRGEALEMEYMLEWYWRELLKERKILFQAFVRRHELFNQDGEGRAWETLTQKEKDLIRKANLMAGALTSKTHHKALAE